MGEEVDRHSVVPTNGTKPTMADFDRDLANVGGGGQTAIVFIIVALILGAALYGLSGHIMSEQEKIQTLPTQPKI
jgi:hypothetical protein